MVAHYHGLSRDMRLRRRIVLSLGGVLLLAVVVRLAFISVYFDRDWEYDGYAHVVLAKWLYARPPESLWEAISWFAKPLYTVFFGSLYQVLPPQWPALVVTQAANSVLWLIASGLTLLVAREVFRHPLTMVVLAVVCGFSFVAFRSSVSANTEPIGALVLALGLYFWHRHRWLAASLCFGLVPLARTDGVFCVAIFGLFAMGEALHVQRSGRIVAALARGAMVALPLLLWHVASFIHSGDFLLIEKEGNLSYAVGATNSGMPWDYIVTFLAFDTAPFLCFAAGAAIVIAAPRQAGQVLVVSTLMALAYFVAMTVLWTWGLFGISGFVRYFVFAYPLYILVAGVAVDRLLLRAAQSERLSAERVATALSLAVLFQLHWFAHGMATINHNNSLPPESELARLPDLAAEWGDKTTYADYPEVVYYLCRGRLYCATHSLAEVADPRAHGVFIFVAIGQDTSDPGGSLSSFDTMVLRGKLIGPYRHLAYIFER